MPPPSENPFYQHTIAITELVEKIKKDAGKYDIIHNHVYPEFLPLLVSNEINTPILTTPHLYMWPKLVEIFKKFQNTYFVAISNYQREKGKGINFVDTVYNGIDVEEFKFSNTPKDYYLFFGRIKRFKNEKGEAVEAKGVLDAIKVCKVANVKLMIAGNVEDKDFFEEEIRPQLDENITFIGPVDASGPIGFEQKVELYKNALGYFFLSHWDEGCPLSPLEAMACGTPVIANRRSSLPEEIIDGKTGFIVEENDINGTVMAVKNIEKINRLDCRKHVEENFSAKKMAEGYEMVYNKILANRTKN